MKLHDAMQKIIRQFGTPVLAESRLMSLLADYKAFDDFPAMKDVMKEILSGGFGKELSSRSKGTDDTQFHSYAETVRKSLVSEKHFKKDFASYAVESIEFAMGIIPDLTEPSDHGYDPYEKPAPAADKSPAAEKSSSSGSGSSESGESGSSAGWIVAAAAAAAAAAGGLIWFLGRKKNSQCCGGLTIPYLQYHSQES